MSIRPATFHTLDESNAEAQVISIPGGVPELFTQTKRDRADFYRGFGKRGIDFLAAFAGIVLFSPFWILISALVAITSRGPAFFRQERVGREGKIFRIVKFRSMVAGADKIGSGITRAGDARVTRFGSVIRKLKIDEIPQLWNVLVGDMSLVGPRPELPCYVANYTPEQRAVLVVRPGITDISSLRYRHEEELLARSHNPEEFYEKVVLPDKLALNLEYIQNMSFFFDLKLIFQTIVAVFF